MPEVIIYFVRRSHGYRTNSYDCRTNSYGSRAILTNRNGKQSQGYRTADVNKALQALSTIKVHEDFWFFFQNLGYICLKFTFGPTFATKKLESGPT